MLRFFLAAALLTACKSEPPVEGPFGDCDPLDPSLCALPFPSSFYLKEADTPTGYQVDFREHSLPENRDDVPVQPTFLNEKDGFSTTASLLTYFGDVSLDGVIGHQDLGAYLDADAKTVILDAETGERVPHFVELDMTAETDTRRLLMFRPAVPFEHGRRYVVGVRGLELKSGGPVEVSPAFQALRDDTPTRNYDVEGRREHFETVIFPALEAAGFARSELQLAWDFVTVSRENSLGRVEWMRDDLLSALPEGGPEYRITKVDTHDCAAGEQIGKTIYGMMTVPLYTEVDEPGTKLTRDEHGMPFRNGETETEFMVRIPCSLLADPKPAMVLQYGHGLLGDKSEARTGWLSRMANEREWIVLAMDWKGMSEDDVPDISLMLVQDITDFPLLPERSMQGFVEWVAAVELIQGALADDPELTVDGTALVDRKKLGYYGNSQGAILGGAYVALSPHIERAVLGVGGAPYNILLTRSSDFDPFFLVFKAKYTDHRDIILGLGLMQMLWDPAEAAGWMGEMGDKQILMQVAIHDAQVTTLGAHVMARAYGAPTVAPQTRAVWGLEEVAPGFTGSALVEWKYSDVPDEPVVNVPPDKELDTHECPRREPAAQQQVYDFLSTGVINQHCEGPCIGVRAGFCD